MPTDKGLLGSALQATPRLPEGPVRPIGRFSPRFRRVFVAFSSRSTMSPQDGQMWVRTERLFGRRAPHPLHSWDVHAGGTATTRRPAYAAVPSRRARNAAHPASESDWASWRVRTLLATRKSSRSIVSAVLSSASAVLCWKSVRCRRTCCCGLAHSATACFRRLLPVFRRLPPCCAWASSLAAFGGGPGGSPASPSPLLRPPRSPHPGP